MKKFAIFCLALILCVSFTGSAIAFAMDGNTDDGAYMTSGNQSLDFDCKSAYLMDFNTNTLIYEKNSDERYPIASMCKIMTLLLVFEAVDETVISLESNIVVSDTAAKMGGSQAFLEANQSYKISDLVKSIVIASANDSSVALAETIAGSESAFVDRMNNRAKALKLENTLFSNCTGLPKPNQYSSAKDVSVMTRELLKHKEYYNYSTIWLDNMIHTGGRVTELANTNKLVRFYKGCDSGKTGYTDEAKHCLSASALRDGTRLIATVLGAPDSKVRFAAVSQMFNYGFANFKNVKLVDSNKALDPLAVRKGKQPKIELKYESDFYIFTKIGDEKNYKTEFDLPEFVSAPIEKDTVVGKAYIVKDNKVVGEVNIMTASSVNKKSYFDYIHDIIREW